MLARTGNKDMYQTHVLAVCALVSTIGGSLITKDVEVLILRFLFCGCIAGLVFSKVVHWGFGITKGNKYGEGDRLLGRERGNSKAEKMIKPKEAKRMDGSGGGLLEILYPSMQSEGNLRAEKTIKPDRAKRVDGSDERLSEKLRFREQSEGNLRAEKTMEAEEANGIGGSG